MNSVANTDSTIATRLADELMAVILRASAVIRAEDYRHVSQRRKADMSAVTAADEASQAVIMDALARLCPDIPVVSEEATERWRSERPSGPFFLVDPLDGTKEFLAGRDEYTVNIALIRDGAPVLGLVAAPAQHLVWRGVVGRGAERLRYAPDDAAALETLAIHTRPWPTQGRTAAVSRSHCDAATTALLERFAPIEPVSCGSALKFCQLAEGTIDLYPRLGPTSEWDVAAGHALVVAAGGAVMRPDGTPLLYTGSGDFLVPGFMAWGDPKAARSVA